MRPELFSMVAEITNEDGTTEMEARGVKTTGLCAEDYLDEWFNREAGEGAFCPDYDIEDLDAANLKEPPELFPGVAGITDEDGTTKREAQGLGTTGLCAEDCLDEQVNRKADDDGATKQGDGGLKRIELGETQEHDGPPVFVTEISAGEAADSLVKKMATTDIPTAVDGDDAPARFNSTQVEDGSAIDPCEDQAWEDAGARGNTPGKDRKERRSTDGKKIGIMWVGEQAPQINRRFYLGLDRASMIARNAMTRLLRRGQTAIIEDGDSGG